MKNKLTQAILRTLIYSDIFDFPLMASEIYRYLMEHPCSERQFATALQSAVARGSLDINQWQGYFYLGDKKWAVEQRTKREKIAREKLKKAKKLTAILKPIPWIKMVVVTGRVAALNCEKDDDIDLMIVTAKRRLWLARFFEWLILSLLGRRRKPHQVKDLKDKLCPNLYISEDNLEFPQQDLFTTNELARAKVVWERGGAWQKLLKANAWVKNFLPNWWLGQGRVEGRGSRVDKEDGRSKIDWSSGGPKGFRLFSSIFDLLERLARSLQLKYMQKRRTREKVENGLLMFHPQDVRGKVLQEYSRRISLLKTSKGSGAA